MEDVKEMENNKKRELCYQAEEKARKKWTTLYPQYKNPPETLETERLKEINSKGYTAYKQTKLQHTQTNISPSTSTTNKIAFGHVKVLEREQDMHFKELNRGNFKYGQSDYVRPPPFSKTIDSYFFHMGDTNIENIPFEKIKKFI